MKEPGSRRAKPEIAVLHYTASPVIGGVEAVIQAHVRLFLDAGYGTTVIAGRGSGDALPSGAGFLHIPVLDTQAPEILQVSQVLEGGEVPLAFDSLVSQIAGTLEAVAGRYDCLIVHNVFTKHFNLPLTAALARLSEAGLLPSCIAWCHDLSWTSSNSRSKVHPGYPWDLLRTPLAGVAYVAVSEERSRELVGLFNCPIEDIRVVYNGVDPQELLGLSPLGLSLVEGMGLLESDLVVLAPVRVTRAKNLEFTTRVTAALKNRGLQVRVVVTGPPDPHDAGSMDYFRSLQELRVEFGVEQELRYVSECGPDPGEPFTIPYAVVGELLRVSDVVFMPSHREGFGMPVLEAGIAGIPVVSADIPAAREIGREAVAILDLEQGTLRAADQIFEAVDRTSVGRLRRRVRQRYTWKAIFEQDIQPLIEDQRRVE
jgi:glycosyltransferase involved in cell wall biosynthesis